MRRLLMTTLISSVCATSAMAAAPSMTAATTAPAGIGLSDLAPESLWLAKEHKGDRGKKLKKAKKSKKEKKAKKHKPDHDKNAKGKDKPEKAEKPAKPKKAKDLAKQKPADFEKRVERFVQDRGETVERLLRTPAPEGRDMVKILGASALALAAPSLNIAETAEDEVVTYRNCPPGLAKKNPPCVPPGLAKKGVTYEEWASYSDEELDALLAERREPYVEAEPLTERELLLLTSEQVADLYKLDPAPEGHRYALIDGQPVLLTTEDYTALLRINELAEVPVLGREVTVAPTAALTQADLINLYRLPEPEEGYNYAVLNGQVVSLRDDAYEILQLIRVARAVL